MNKSYDRNIFYIEEKFIDQRIFANLDVTFNKKEFLII